MESQSLQFASTVRTIGSAARSRDLVVPGFRSPPRLPGLDRTIRRGHEGAPTVAVVIRDRPFQAVVADLIEGVVVANDLYGADATRLRTALWEAVVSTDSASDLAGAA